MEAAHLKRSSFLFQCNCDIYIVRSVLAKLLLMHQDEVVCFLSHLHTPGYAEISDRVLKSNHLFPLS
jgi:hypothetical protein